MPALADNRARRSQVGIQAAKRFTKINGNSLLRGNGFVTPL
jgi:hypothetical protein